MLHTNGLTGMSVRAVGADSAFCNTVQGAFIAALSLRHRTSNSFHIGHEMLLKRSEI